MDERLREAAHEGNIQRLYALIREDQSILERYIDDRLLADTPLHIAASTGDHHFAAEDGLSPIHLALRSEHYRMVEWFVSVDSNLVRDKGEEGTTPLHYVTALGNINLLRFFLFACPDCIEDLTTKRETALHIALKYYDPSIFEALVGWLKKVEKEYILNWPDEDGNTVLHMATSKNQAQAVKLLLSKKMIRKIKVNAKNSMGETALDIFEPSRELDNKEIRKMLGRAKALRGISINHEPLEEIDKTSKEMPQLHDMSNQAVLTVAVLIATATFQAVLSPPGGLWQDYYMPRFNTTANTNTDEAIMDFNVKHYAGTSTMTSLRFFEFYLLNSATFYASMGLIRLQTQALPHRLLHISYFFLCATYYCSLFAIQPINTDSAKSSIHIYLVMLLHSQNVVCILAVIFAPHLLKLTVLFNKNARVLNSLIVALFLGYAIYLSI